jgi:hypothetical protein
MLLLPPMRASPRWLMIDSMLSEPKRDIAETAPTPYGRIVSLDTGSRDGSGAAASSRPEANGPRPAAGLVRHETPELLRLAQRLKSGKVGLPTVDWGLSAKTLSTEERAAVINLMLDADEAPPGRSRSPDREPACAQRTPSSGDLVAWDSRSVGGPEPSVAEPIRHGEPEVVGIPLDDLVAAYKALRELAVLGRTDPGEWRAMSALRMRVGLLAEAPLRRLGVALPRAVRDAADREVAARMRPPSAPDLGITEIDATFGRAGEFGKAAEGRGIDRWRPPSAPVQQAPARHAGASHQWNPESRPANLCSSQSWPSSGGWQSLAGARPTASIGGGVEDAAKEAVARILLAVERTPVGS